jgi:uncharacterized protein (DUF1800 family)
MAAIPWNETNAAHLLRRAGYGGTSGEVTQAVRDGLDATVNRLVDYDGIDNSALDARLTAAGLDLTTTQGIIRWWLTRILFTARPLEERMTFFWHDHFATAISKVNDQALMLQQNRTLRQYAMGNFRDLLTAVSKDPAMLIWLDNAQSVKDHPNENYGRELLELFGLGIGHYSEVDVLSAAKAFTGWTLTRPARQFVFVDRNHDHTQKDFLGRVGDWDGTDIIRIICEEFANAQLIAGKLFEYFAYEAPDQSTINKFAQVYVDNNNEIRPTVRAILKSEEMYSGRALWQKVKSPVDFVAIALRQAMINSDQTRLASGVLNAQGQTPFNPPDVSGWTSGLEWINSGTLLGRVNFSNNVANNLDPVGFTSGENVATADQLVDVYLRKLGPLSISSSSRAQLVKYVAPNGTMPTGNALTTKKRGLLQLVFSLPEWQMN